MKAALVLLVTVMLLLSVSATFLSALMKRTSSISASIHRNMGSNSISTTELTGALLSGYLADTTYTDEGCTAVSYADIYFLNKCFFDGGYYISFAANSTAYVLSVYNDAACQQLLYTGKPAHYSSNCRNSRKIFINSQAEVISSQSICYAT